MYITSSPIVVTVDAMHRPVEFFHLHAGIADNFHHGGQRFQRFKTVKVKVFHSLIAVEAVGVIGVPLYLGHS